jgi:hypothetical protein
MQIGMIWTEGDAGPLNVASEGRTNSVRQITEQITVVPNRVIGSIGSGLFGVRLSQKQAASTLTPGKDYRNCAYFG